MLTTYNNRYMLNVIGRKKLFICNDKVALFHFHFTPRAQHALKNLHCTKAMCLFIMLVLAYH